MLYRLLLRYIQARLIGHLLGRLLKDKKLQALSANKKTIILFLLNTFFTGLKQKKVP